MRLPAAILAGGLSRRMGGGDKCLLPLGGGVVLDHVLARLKPQAGPIMLNANGDPARFAIFDLKVCPDSLPGLLGPLAGILTAMRWGAQSGFLQVATVAADMPFLPADLIATLLAATEGTHIAAAATEDRLHPVAGVWPVSLADRLEHDLLSGERRVRGWLSSVGFRTVRFSSAADFTNLNNICDWQQAILANAARTMPARSGNHHIIDSIR